MRRGDDGLLLSATDLGNHLACRHLTQVDRAVAEGRLQPPAWHDPMLATLRQRGMEHEAAYVEHLRRQGLEVADLSPSEPGGQARETTQAAMARGAGVIVQAELAGGRWRGRADVLLRVPAPSRLGDWSYEVVDTKLAQETRGSTILQLCLYSDLVAQLQERQPERMHVVKTGKGFEPESFRFPEFAAYYRLVRRRLEAAADGPADDGIYPAPVLHCDICRWWQQCDARRHADDHLCLVAGLRSLHQTELQRQGIRTLAQFAAEPAPLREKPKRGNEEAFERSQGQARIQLAGRRAGAPCHELLPYVAEQGLARLPVPDAGDVFFDLEADPFVADGGLEYLVGHASRGADGTLDYQARWALSRHDERLAFEAFVDFVTARRREFPGLHVYHYSPYEPGALKRLMGRHATRETEMDELLRGRCFVDLLAVTRQGVRASVESYSLKELERFFSFTRGVELRQASAALRRVERALELGDREVSAADRALVESYNRDDCLATAALRDWLEERREELVRSGQSVPRPDPKEGEASEAITERSKKVDKVFRDLVAGLPEDRAAWSDAERARWLLAHQLDYFRREDRCAWWEYYTMHGREEDELLDERKAVAGLRFEGEVEGGTPKCPIHRYAFPPQEVSLDEGDVLHEVGDGEVGKVAGLDRARCTLDIKKTHKARDVHPRAVLVYERVNPEPLDGSLLALARSVADHGVDGNGPFRAARDLLLRRPPRLHDAGGAVLRHEGESAVDAAVRLVKLLDHGVLPIQGPPGTGKTHAGARMIVELARAGKRVGVTAVSHKVIRNLLDTVLEAAAEARTDVAVAHKVTKESGDTTGRVEELKDNDEALARLDQGKVLGGSAWLWARNDAVESLDYLFVDEAGQMSLAHVLAAARCARNLVLLGDPRQLEQPQRGAHPEGAEIAALAHVLAGRETIADDRGLFLDLTWRLHPSLCAFTSEAFYEGRLSSQPGLEQQALHGRVPFAGSGLFFVPVAHEGNQSSSPEEVEAVAGIVVRLLGSSVTWTDDKGQSQPLQPADILVVAPYNAQVAALSQRLPELRIGTVDKFQGQQAPVVVYSLTSSSAEDAPRGMSFLYSPNRFNVATSRARCACILVGTPRLLEPECRTPEQMRWANALCRYRELATEVT